MPPPLILDLDAINLEEVKYDKEFIYGQMPHRYEFELLDGVSYLSEDCNEAVAYHDCRLDEWWVRGHIPGKPIFPGVLQLEVAAHVIAFMSRYVHKKDVFVAFGGVDDCRFREAVIPPCRLYVLATLTENRSRRVKGKVQGVVNGQIAFHASIAGLAMR